MLIDYNVKLDFDDVLIVPKRSTLGSRKNVDLIRTYTFRHSSVKYTGVPIIAANMDHVGTFEMSAALSKYGVSTALHKYYDMQTMVDRFVSLSYQKIGKEKIYVPLMYSMGIADREFEQLVEFIKLVHESVPTYINVDVANGYTEAFVDHIKKIRELVGERSVIMAGNVVTGDMVSQLLLSGADIVKVGIGPGSVCTTRKMTGVGYPQLSAIIECMDAAHQLDGHICADGGCKQPADVVKAFAAGADFVMLGGMLAGHDECSGEVLHNRGHIVNDDPKMKFYGMSSKEAMDQYAGGVADYRASEGKSVLVDYKGPVKDTIQQILGGLRSACTYAGAKRLKDLSKCTTFVLVNRTHNTTFGE